MIFFPGIYRALGYCCTLALCFSYKKSPPFCFRPGLYCCLTLVDTKIALFFWSSRPFVEPHTFLLQFDVVFNRKIKKMKPMPELCEGWEQQQFRRPLNEKRTETIAKKTAIQKGYPTGCSLMGSVLLFHWTSQISRGLCWLQFSQKISMPLWPIGPLLD